MVKKLIVLKDNIWIFLTVLLVIVLSIISFGSAIDYNLVDDDWIGLWLAMNNPHLYRAWVSTSWHPGQIFNIFPWIFAFGTNHYLWQGFGLLLKIVVALLVGLAMYAITRSKKSFVIGSLLYSVFPGGLEAYAWVSGRISAYLNIVCLLTVICYVLYRRKEKFYFLWLTGVFLGVVCSLLMDPYRALVFVCLLFLWELLFLFIEGTLFTKKKIIIFFSLLVIIVFSLKQTSIGSSFFSQSKLEFYTNTMQASVAYGNNFFSSIGKLFIYSFNPLEQYNHYSAYSLASMLLGIGFCMVTIIAGMYVLIRRKVSMVYIVIFSLWTSLSYFPNWMTNLKWASDITHRFQAIPGVGFILLITYLLSLLPKKAHIATCCIVLILIITNMLASFAVVHADYSIRGYRYTQPILSKIEQDIPHNTQKAMLWLETNNWYIAEYFGSGGGIAPAIALNKHISLADSYFSASDIAFSGKIVCEKNLNRPYSFGWSVQKTPLPIEDVFGWRVDGNYGVENITNEIRLKIAHKSSCYSENIQEEVIPGITLSNIAYLKNLYKQPGQVLSIDWNSTDKHIHSIQGTVDIYSTKGDLLAQKSFVTTPNEDNVYETNIYSNQTQATADYLQITVNSCEKECSKNNVQKTYSLKGITAVTR